MVNERDLSDEGTTESQDLLKDDGISPEEQAFMEGYEQAAEDDDEDDSFEEEYEKEFGGKPKAKLEEE